MKLVLRTYNLQLKHTFTISRQSFDSKKVLIVELKDGGYSGFGEASENPYYHQTLDTMIDDLSRVKNEIEYGLQETPEVFWRRMYPLLKENMFGAGSS